MFEKKRVFILVKTYPTISDKYSELVCTAGVLEDGSWIRLYPIPFRLLEENQKYKKYTWINVLAERNYSDFRPESYRPDLSSIEVEPDLPKIKGRVNWNARRDIILKDNIVYTDLSSLISEAKSTKKSLAIFKPKRIKRFIVTPTEREWDPEKVKHLKDQAMQISLFSSPEEMNYEFQIVQKIPYHFKYEFEDDDNKTATLMVEDWEIGMLYLNCLKKHQYDEVAAIADVKKKYYDEFLTKDLYFFLGTTKKWHNVAINPFIIIGVFYPPFI